VNLRGPAQALWLTSLTAAAPVMAQPAQPQATAASTAEPAAKLSPLLGQVLGRVTSQVAPSADANTAAQDGLFRRLALQHKGALQGADSAKSTAMVPALGYAMEQLDPGSFAVLRPVAVGGSGAMLRTGDVFVLQFSTSLPGQVRLENIDPKGRVADLGTYTVLVDQLNRLPRDKGIQLQGQPGLERLRFYFYPCLPAEAAGKRWAADFQGKLPACAAAPVQQTTLSRALGVVAPRALVNLSQPDAHLAFAGSNDYQPGEVTLMEAQIRHEGRTHAR
jgi:hypothetical protein